MTDDMELEGPHSKGVAFGLWFAWLVGFAGIHRFYLGRKGTGFLYLFTFGLLGIGQIIDLFRLPDMVAEENTKALAYQALEEKRALMALRARKLLPAASGESVEDTPEQFRIKLVRAAAKHGGTLSVTQGVMATGKAFEEVEKALDEMAKSGYVGIDNHEKTGAVVYTFGELDPDDARG